jgi:hypothetical protein
MEQEQQPQPQQEAPTPEAIEAFRAYDEARLQREVLSRRCLLGFLRMPS